MMMMTVAKEKKTMGVQPSIWDFFERRRSYKSVKK